MALSADKQSEILVDYHRNGDAQEIPFGSSNTDIQNFWDWFGETASQWPVLEEASPSPDMHSTLSACFTNAQRNALATEMEYCEGFYRKGGTHYVHAFNIEKGKVVDFTTINNGPNDDTEYFGVIIPKELIEEYNPGVSIGEGASLGSLLYQYFSDNC